VNRIVSRIAVIAIPVAFAAVHVPNRPAAVVDNLAPTPPMGWNSWNKFGCRIDEKLIRETADAMVATGMKDAGYQYVNIDDCWEDSVRDAKGRLATEPTRFPSGMKALADYVHTKGLKIGIYSSAGTGTCQRRPASLDHEVVDAQTFADWGIDYLKYDNCNNQNRPALERYKAMGDALKATGRAIVYSLCEWGQNKSWEWGKSVGGHLWRTTGDISDRWSSVLSLLDRQVGLEAFSGPNAWNDPDMLEVGNGRMTNAEYISHFSLWALMNAPLISGNDLRSMSDSTKIILTNKEVIAINQDWGGKQGTRVRGDGAREIWMKPMANGDKAVILFNRADIGNDVSVSMAELGLSPGAHQARDVWAHANVKLTDPTMVSLSRHSVMMYVIKK
jgi:alpha-galactosidase